nr:tn3 transposase [Cryobacterium sp.]
MEWQRLLAVPESEEDLIREYTFTSSELELIRSRRGDANRLGFAVQLAYIRFPGISLGTAEPSPRILAVVAGQVGVREVLWADYGRRDETRREHALELRSALGVRRFTDDVAAEALAALEPVAIETDKATAVADAAVEFLRSWMVLLPTVGTLDELVSAAITAANRAVYSALADGLTTEQKRALDAVLRPRSDGQGTQLTWLRQSPLKPNSKHMRAHLDRLRAWRRIGLPVGLGFAVRQSRLLKLAREGAQMSAGDLAKFEPQRRYATLAAVAIESEATIIDEVIELHDRILGRVFNQAKNRHRDEFHDSGREINDKVLLFSRVGQLLVTAREEGVDPFAAIDAAIGWEAFQRSVTEAKAVARGKNFDSLPQIRDSYAMLRRYTPDLLQTLTFTAAPAAADLLDAVDVVRELNRTGSRLVPGTAPRSIVRPRWARVVFAEDGTIDRAFYEMCVLAEVRNALRSGDLWVEGSRQYKDLDGYLIPAPAFASLTANDTVPVNFPVNVDDYLGGEIAEVERQLALVDEQGGTGELPGVSIEGGRLRIEAADTIVPAEAEQLITRAAGMLPRVPITDILVEVNNWTGFADVFTHLKTGEPARDTHMLLTVVLADGINLGLTKMADACAGATYAKMLRLQAMHVRDETYSAALATIVNAQHQHPFAAHFGDGTTSSSDGQRFRAGNSAEATGHINPKYGSTPGRLIYTHVSDQYAPFHSQLVNVGVRDATYVIDGLLHHESDLDIREHYTDTAGFTDHVFALTHLLGFQFAPRIRDLAETRLYTPRSRSYPNLDPLIGGTISTALIRTHWPEILRLAASIKTGTVSASLMLRKLGAYPRQNGLAHALRELGRLQRTRFILDWLQNPDLRRRTTAGLNKGEARNALARAVFFNRLGEIRDRSFEQQRYRTSGLNLVTAAIVLWNTVYLDRAIQTLQNTGNGVNPELIQHLSPLGWEHINLTGNYTWRNPTKPGRYRPLRSPGRRQP